MDDDICIFREKALQLNIRLNDTQIAQFDRYKDELLQWNTRTNLISENSSRDIFTRHFLDSLSALQFISRPGAKMIDIGSGAGFPGMPLKIAMPSLDLFLLEANRKKVSFLKNMIRLLQLDGAQVLHDRVEHVIRNDDYKEKFDVMISRATFKLSDFIELGNYFLIAGGVFIAWKGPKADEEINHYRTVKNQGKIPQLIQHDIEADFWDAPHKIIIGKK